MTRYQGEAIAGRGRAAPPRIDQARVQLDINAAWLGNAVAALTVALFLSIGISVAWSVFGLVVSAGLLTIVLVLRRPERMRFTGVAVLILLTLCLARAGSATAWTLLARAKGATAGMVEQTLSHEVAALRRHARARAGLLPMAEAERVNEMRGTLFGSGIIKSVSFGGPDSLATNGTLKPGDFKHEWTMLDLEPGPGNAAVALWRQDGVWVAKYREMLGPPAEPGCWFEIVQKL